MLYFPPSSGWTGTIFQSRFTRMMVAYHAIHLLQQSESNRTQVWNTLAWKSLLLSNLLYHLCHIPIRNPHLCSNLWADHWKTLNAIKIWALKFLFPLQFYNPLIHQFWKSINTGISCSQPLLLSQLFQKSFPCLSASNHKYGMAGEGEAWLPASGLKKKKSKQMPHPALALTCNGANFDLVRL